MYQDDRCRLWKFEVQAARSDSRGALLVVRFGAANDGRVFLEKKKGRELV